MKKIIISRGQRLIDVLPLHMIPSNTIVSKTITGCGATYSELKAQRNSIIIEPNVPVIKGKCNDPKHKQDNLLGVYEKIQDDDIVDYLIKSRKQQKKVKILTTPESFLKVKRAFERLNIDMLHDGYFLLFDECQKLVKDPDYRDSITLPMDFFFGCNDKAIVSATVPHFSDKRFDSFSVLEVIPDYDYRQEIHVQTTNNVLQRLRDLLISLEKRNVPVFIFVNYTDMIYALMTQLEIIERSSVFCSNKSVMKLKNDRKFKHAFEEFKPEHQRDYNFLTSRFYSALDIEIEQKPIVVMVTDCNEADYTMFDPNDDVVQLIGRFRNGVSAVYHITNINPNIPNRTLVDIQCAVKAQREVYQTIKTFRNDSPNKYLQEAFIDALETLHYNKFLDNNKEENSFKVDNYIADEMMATYYNSKEHLLQIYEGNDHFKGVTLSEPQDYPFGDFDRLKVSHISSRKERRKEIVRQLEELGDATTSFAIEHKRALRDLDKFIVVAYDKLGAQTIKDLNYSEAKIKKQLLLLAHQKKARSTDALKLIYATFQEGRTYSVAEVKTLLSSIYNELGIPQKYFGTSKRIEEYFHVLNKPNKGGMAYYLLRRKFVVE